jgi:hypothetical protein
MVVFSKLYCTVTVTVAVAVMDALDASVPVTVNT